MGRLSAGAVNFGQKYADNQGLGWPSEAAPERHEIAKVPLGNSDLTTEFVVRQHPALDQASHRLVGDGQDVGDLLKGQEWRLRQERAGHDQQAPTRALGTLISSSIQPSIAEALQPDAQPILTGLGKRPAATSL